MENKKREPTPAATLFERLEKPLATITNASALNNEAVKLFTEGQLNLDQLIKFSVRFAKAADELSHKNPQNRQQPKRNAGK